MSRLGLLPLRVVVGVVFLMHGYQKLLVWGVGGVAGFFTQVGVPLPGVVAPVVSLVEFLGGLAILLGVYARWVGVALAIDMVGAILFARLKGGFFAPNGFEFELTLCGAALTIAAVGSGPLSLDRYLPRRGGS